jgi:hypothetical protein
MRQRGSQREVISPAVLRAEAEGVTQIAVSADNGGLRTLLFGLFALPAAVPASPPAPHTPSCFTYAHTE